MCLSVKSHLTSGVSVHPEKKKELSHTQRAMEVKQVVGFSLKLLRYRDPGLPPLKAICMVGYFPADSTYAHYSIFHVLAPRVLHFSEFISLY